MKIFKSKWLLLTVCLLVWGGVIYSAIGEKNERKPSTINHHHLLDTDEPVDSGFQLVLNYDDPFLSSNLGKKKEKSTTKKRTHRSNFEVSRTTMQSRIAKNKPESKKKKNIVFPSITYHGNVKISGGGQAAVVNLDGQIINWPSGKINEDIRLRKIWRDSISIEKGGVKKTIVLQ